jgi:hypothetical protein
MTDTARYRGDVTPIDGTHLFGPDRFSALYVATAATYDPETDITEVTLRPLPPAEKNERVKALISEELQRRHLQRLFVGPKS